MTTARILAAAVTLMAVAGCGGGGTKPSAVASMETSLQASHTPAAPTPSETPASKPTATPKTSTPQQQTGPKIEYFRIKTKPSCPSSGPGATFPGNPITLEWKVTGTDKVTISIDGPGIFGTYEATYQHEFPFPCSGTSGTIQKHTYLLKTVGGGTVRSQELTGEARIN